ncbi:cytochrome P450 [Streptomyces collinus]|uniref:cytochrome P450 n=1 Tax=Streptomyces collinus TaxID=42684 RepID=UPI0036CFF7F6
MFQKHSRTILTLYNTPEEATEAMNALGEYLHRLAAQHRSASGDDLLSASVQRQEAAEMSDEDIVAMARLLLIAGHETTANQIGLAVLALFEHLALLREDPTLAASAVEELLRYQSIARTSMSRVAIADVPLPGGQTIRSGDGIVLAIKSANHDPDFLPEPDDLDIRRTARGHVAFGYGVHQCVGQAPARLELQIALTELLRAFPDLRPSRPLEETRLRDSTAVLGLWELPVTW